MLRNDGWRWNNPDRHTHAISVTISAAADQISNYDQQVVMP
jgi:hypothetical protein